VVLRWVVVPVYGFTAVLVVVDCVAVVAGVGSSTVVQLGRAAPQAIAMRPRVINDGFMVIVVYSAG
jgi:hypothetical protein